MRTTRSLLALGILLGSLQLGASAGIFTEGAEQTQVALTRTSLSGQSLSTQLIKNDYRYVERTEHYVEQVPYDVQVPYQEEETYYENETRCGLVPRSREICHNEERCEVVSHQVCHDETKCERTLADAAGLLIAQVSSSEMLNMAAGKGGGGSTGGGHTGGGSTGGGSTGGGHTGGGSTGGGHTGGGSTGGGSTGGGSTGGGSTGGGSTGGGHTGGGSTGGGHTGGGSTGGGDGHHGGEVCHTTSHCIPSNERVCHQQPSCHTESYSENVCQSVSVPHTRLVTRLRTVTEYRPEDRIRTVTDKIFDHAWGPAVTIILPAQSALGGDEAEAVLVQLAGDESNPDAEVSIDSPIFSYRVADKQRSGNTITVTMELVAKYAAADLGSQTVTGLAFVNAGNGYFQVRFTDAGQASRVNTTYAVQVLDRGSNQIVFTTTAAGAMGVRDVVIPVTAQVNSDSDHVVQLNVSREGIVLAGPVAFAQTAEQLAQLDPAPYLDVNGVREFTAAGTGASAQLVFIDAAGTAGVDTQYDITIQEKVWGFLWENTVAHGVFNRTQLTQTGGHVSLAMNLFPGLSQSKLDSLFSSGSKFFVKVVVTRRSDRLKGYSPITIKKQADLRIAQGRQGS